MWICLCPPAVKSLYITMRFEIAMPCRMYILMNLSIGCWPVLNKVKELLGKLAKTCKCVSVCVCVGGEMCVCVCVRACVSVCVCLDVS